jgi:type ISP restriction-modification system protein
VTERFKEYSSVVKTHRDHFVVGFEKDELLGKFDKFIQNDINFTKGELKLKDKRDWKVEIAKEKTKEIEISNYILDYPNLSCRHCYSIVQKPLLFRPTAGTFLQL